MENERVSSPGHYMRELGITSTRMVFRKAIRHEAANLLANSSTGAAAQAVSGCDRMSRATRGRIFGTRGAVTDPASRAMRVRSAVAFRRHA